MFIVVSLRSFTHGAGARVYRSGSIVQAIHFFLSVKENSITYSTDTVFVMAESLNCNYHFVETSL